MLGGIAASSTTFLFGVMPSCALAVGYCFFLSYYEQLRREDKQVSASKNDNKEGLL